MTVAKVASSHTMKLLKFTLSIIRPTFKSAKCKTAAKMAVARIKLLRNKREVVVRQMRRDIASLLQTGQDSTARVRVEHVIREQNVLAANEFVELFCELVVARLTIIAKQKECPADLKEGISSLIFAAPRCSEIPELITIRDIFEKKYGKDFVSAATDLRPSCGVNRMLIDKLSVRTPSGEVKLKVLKEIAKEHQIDWDTAESEKELLKPPEELIEGPHTFVSASSLPVKPAPNKPIEPNKPIARPTNDGEMENMHFQDTTSAAEAAAEAAKQAVAAANAAAFLANNGNPVTQAPFRNASGNHHKYSPLYGDSRSLSMRNNAEFSNHIRDHQSNGPGRMYESHHYDSFHQESNETGPVRMDNEYIYRRHSQNETRRVQMDQDNLYKRHSYNDTRPVHMDNKNASKGNCYNSSSPRSDIKFDESDYDEEMDVESPPASGYAPPERPPPPAPSSQDTVHRVHPKLPDYDALTARFEALKYHKSQT